MWQNGTVIDLNPGHTFSTPTGINNAGEVIGYYTVESDFLYQDVPFTWDAANGLTLLPVNGGEGEPDAINQEGQIVGGIGDSPGGGALWENGVVYNLNDLVPADSGWVLDEAYGINDLGQIVGWGDYDGQLEGYLLTPAPEPMGMVVAAGVGFWCCSLRRR